MGNIILSVLCFIGLYAYMFILYRAWFNHLIKLASISNITEARKKASRHFFIVIILLAIPFISTIALVIHLHAISKYLLPFLLAMSVVPNIIWWQKKWPILRNLGYGSLHA